MALYRRCNWRQNKYGIMLKTCDRNHVKMIQCGLCKGASRASDYRESSDLVQEFV